jgi:DNA-binding MarR family transcriptional regulator
VKKVNFTKNEEKVLYGIVKYPNLNDTTLSSKLDVKLSTFTSIKKRLSDEGYFRTINIPLLNRLGCELLTIIYARFNPVIPLEERIGTTKKTIEIFEEIFFSVGEQDKGFSISISKNYSNIGRINDIRTETFGKLGLLEEEYPQEVIFSFENSNINHFFDFSRVLKNLFSIEDNNKITDNISWFNNIKQAQLSNKEKKIYLALVENSDDSTKEIGKKVGVSRHTIARMKKEFIKNGFIKRITLPNLQKLGFEILAFYPINFNPSKAPNKKDLQILDTNSTIFMVNRLFETILISAYPTYQDYKEDKMFKIRYLKENNLISTNPLIGEYMFERMVIIKDFDFAPLVKKTLLL